MKSGIIEDLEKQENIMVLIRKSEYSKNWQHPVSVTDYVEENYELFGQISIYNVYVK